MPQHASNRGAVSQRGSRSPAARTRYERWSLLREKRAADAPIRIAHLGHEGAETVLIHVPDFDRALDAAIWIELAGELELAPDREPGCRPYEKTATAHVLDVARHGIVVADLERAVEADRHALLGALLGFIHSGARLEVLVVGDYRTTRRAAQRFSAHGRTVKHDHTALFRSEQRPTAGQERRRVNAAMCG